jgi:hypothetical protein
MTVGSVSTESGKRHQDVDGGMRRRKESETRRELITSTAVAIAVARRISNMVTTKKVGVFPRSFPSPMFGCEMMGNGFYCYHRTLPTESYLTYCL